MRHDIQEAYQHLQKYVHIICNDGLILRPFEIQQGIVKLREAAYWLKKGADL